jgi:hypothetical protein
MPSYKFYTHNILLLIDQAFLYKIKCEAVELCFLKNDLGQN